MRPASWCWELRVTHDAHRTVSDARRALSGPSIVCAFEKDKSGSRLCRASSSDRGTEVFVGARPAPEFAGRRVHLYASELRRRIRAEHDRGRARLGACNSSNSKTDVRPAHRGAEAWGDLGLLRAGERSPLELSWSERHLSGGVRRDVSAAHR